MFLSIIYLSSLQVQDRKARPYDHHEDIKGVISSQKRTDNALVTMKKDKKTNNSQHNNI